MHELKHVETPYYDVSTHIINILSNYQFTITRFTVPPVFTM
jgi:hypothetical protein